MKRSNPNKKNLQGLNKHLPAIRVQQPARGLVAGASATCSVDLAFDLFVESYQDLKSWYSQLPCLTFSIKGIVWWLENKPTSSLVALLVKILTLYLWVVKTSGKDGSYLLSW